MIWCNIAAGSRICTNWAIRVKHGVVVSVVNLYADVVGNPNPPERLKASKRISQRTVRSDPVKRSPVLIAAVIVGLMLFTLAVLAIVFAPAILKQMRSAKTEPAPVPAASVVPATSSIPDKSIAVLPFENLSDEAERIFHRRVQDQILADLAKIADLKVISRTSVMQYKSGTPRNLREIGQQLGVARVVEGSVSGPAIGCSDGTTH
jgi:hypothetical protein